MGLSMGLCLADCKHHRTEQHFYKENEFNFTDVLERSAGRLWDGSRTASLSVFAGTWNVGNRPPPQNLADWLQPGHDLYVIGVQECRYEVPSGFDGAAAHWFHCVSSVLVGYTVVCKRSMWANHVVCLAADRVLPHLHSVESSREETGIAHIGPNKGGIAVSLFIGDTSLCFVSSHLAAHATEVERRNSDHSEIIEGIRLGIRNKPLTNQFTHVIWVGDLNYRIDLGAEECEALVRAGDWERLYRYDQLRRVRDERKAFYLFHEGKLAFPPTYKHTAGEPPDAFSGLRPYRLSAKHTPSWTDRILWRSFPDTELTLVPGSYTSTPSVSSSDHSPVSAVFRMPVLAPAQLAVRSRAAPLGDSLPSTPAAAEKAPAAAAAEAGGPKVPAAAAAPRLRVEVRNLRAVGMLPIDISGLMDPFLVLTSRFSDDKVTTAVRRKTLEPDWVGETYSLRPKPVYDNTAALASQHVLVSMYDKDFFKEDDPMGYGVISLLGSDVPGTARPFEVDLSRCGTPAGTLLGEVAIVSVHATPDEEPEVTGTGPAPAL